MTQEEHLKILKRNGKVNLYKRSVGHTYDNPHGLIHSATLFSNNGYAKETTDHTSEQQAVRKLYARLYLDLQKAVFKIEFEKQFK